MFFFKFTFRTAWIKAEKFASNKKNYRIFDANRGLTGSVNIFGRHQRSLLRLCRFQSVTKTFHDKVTKCKSAQKPIFCFQTASNVLAFRSPSRTPLGELSLQHSPDPYLRHYSCYCPARPFELSLGPTGLKTFPCL